MLQKEMIEQFRGTFQADERIVAALMFGSFATGEGDAFSDIEFAVFIEDAGYEAFEPEAFLNGVSPVAAYFLDDFGHHTALFENAVRGEFHFMRASEISVVAGWKGYAWFPRLEDCVLLDRAGELTPYAQAMVGGPPVREGAALVESIGLNLVNLMLFGANLLHRGEYARAWALLGRVHENVLKLVRLQEGTTEHWPTPSRALEVDISPAAYARYLRCTAGAGAHELGSAYQETWAWSRELLAQVAEPLGIVLPTAILARIDELFVELGVR